MFNDVVYLAAGLLGLGLIGIGGFAVVAPGPASRGYGVPVDSDAPASRGYAVASGFRDVGLGAGIVLVWWLAPVPALAGLVLAAAIIPLGDLYVVRTHRVNRPLPYLVHGGGAVVTLLIGALLLMS
jgi:uncharacterized membrane protein